MTVIQENKQKIIENELIWDDRVAAIEITVEVQNSTAILNGQVATYHEKKAAEEDALGVPGIEHVDNRIEVASPPETAIRPDKELKKAVENALEEDSRIDASRINVEVDAGKVTLSGTIDAFWKITVAENLAYNVKGVKEASNKFEISWKDEHTDQKIKDEIKSALERSNAIDHRDVTIEVDKGNVTLRGQAPNIVGKNTATNKASYTAGVVSVNNQLKIT